MIQDEHRPMSRTSRPIRKILDEWLRTQFENTDEVITHELVCAAYQHFADDAEFDEAIKLDGLALIIPELVKALAKHNREMVRTSGGFVARDALEAGRRKFGQLFDHVGGGMRKSLLAMTKPEVQFVIHERKEQVAGELRYIGFYEDVERGLPNTKVRVGEHFSDSALDVLWKKHYET